MLHVGLHLFVVELPANETLERKDGVGSVHDGLPFCGETDETLAMLCEGDDRRRCPCTLGILNHARGLSLHYGDA